MFLSIGMLKQNYFLADIFILSAEKQPIKLSWRKIECLRKKDIPIMIKAIDANMYLLLFVENIAPIQEIDTANCIHFKLNSVVLNIHIDKKDNAKTNSIAFNIYFSFILL